MIPDDVMTKRLGGGIRHGRIAVTNQTLTTPDVELVRSGLNVLAGGISDIGPSRQCTAGQKSGRYWGTADIGRRSAAAASDDSDLPGWPVLRRFRG
jgi:hypothetical protein